MIGSPSRWDKMFDQAMVILDQAGSLMDTHSHSPGSVWSFGCGTAMMLQINHRLSYDVDFFSENPQHLNYIQAFVMDQYVNTELAGYRGDGSSFVKLTFTDAGEIDFVIANHFLADHSRPAIVRGREVLMETIPEIIAKKVFHRGHNIVPRDIYDIAAACHAGLRDDIMDVLRQMPDQFDAFGGILSTIRKNPSEFEKLMGSIIIMPEYESMRKDVLAIVQDLVDDTRAKLETTPPQPAPKKTAEEIMREAIASNDRELVRQAQGMGFNLDRDQIDGASAYELAKAKRADQVVAEIDYLTRHLRPGMSF